MAVIEEICQGKRTLYCCSIVYLHQSPHSRPCWNKTTTTAAAAATRTTTTTQCWRGWRCVLRFSRLWAWRVQCKQSRQWTLLLVYSVDSGTYSDYWRKPPSTNKRATCTLQRENMSKPFSNMRMHLSCVLYQQQKNEQYTLAILQHVIWSL